MRRAIDRYAELDDAADRMLADAGTSIVPAHRHAHTARVEAVELSPTHRQVVELLDEILGLADHANLGPAGALVRSLRRLQPALLRDFATADVEPLVTFLHAFGERCLAIGTPVVDVVALEPTVDVEPLDSE